MGSVSVSSCRCCMFVSCVAVLNAAFCMTRSLLMLVGDARGDQMDGEAGWWTASGNIGLPPLARVMGVDRQQHHMEEEYSRAGLMNRLLVAMSISFSLPHPVTVSGFIICSGMNACTKML